MIWDDTKIISLDFETSGVLPEYALQPWRIPGGEAWITSGSAIRFHEGRLRPHLSQLFPTRAQLEHLLREAIAERWTILGWNIAFDISLLIALGLEELVMRIRWLDGMLLERHYDVEPEYEFQTARHKKKSYSLKGYPDKPGALDRWLPSRVGRHEEIDFHSTDPESLRKLQLYNDDDSADAWLIAKMIWRKLTHRQQVAALIEAEALPLVASANFRGIEPDQLTVHHLAAKLDDDAALELASLAPHGMSEKIVRSPLQLGKLMFDPPAEGGWGLPVLKTNKSKVEGKADTRSTDKEVLHELSFIDMRAAKVKAYREALNAKGKFCTAVTEAIAYNGDGRLHPTANLAATYTHRMTVSSKQGKGKNERPIGFALHQMKREEEFREIITVPEGYSLLEVDAAGQEYRWMACASGDPTMMKLCQPGEDMHSFMGAQILSIDYPQLVADFAAGDKQAKQNRYLGKFANLSLQYRTGPPKLRSKARVDYGIPLELPEAQRIHAVYQRSYPRVPVYWATQIAIVKACGFVETLAGTRTQVKGDWNGKWGWSMGSTAINARIQGTGADQKHLALMVVKPLLTEMGAYFYFELHDGLYFIVPTDRLAKTVERMKSLLDNLPYQQAWGYTPPIPMPWDAKVGIEKTRSCAWGRMKEWKFA